MRQKAQGIEADTAFLQDEVEPQDKVAAEIAELAAAERQYQKQLAKEIGVSLCHESPFENLISQDSSLLCSCSVDSNICHDLKDLSMQDNEDSQVQLLH